MNDRIKMIKSQYNYQINACQGNRFVIPDVHGCLNTLKAIIEKIKITKADQLFFLGDLIDRGPESVGVLKYIDQLKKKFNVFTLKGNHENDYQYLYTLNNPNLTFRYMDPEMYKSTFPNESEENSTWYHMINEMPYFVELEDFILVHAGFDFTNPDPYNNTDEMLWIREFEYNQQLAFNKTIIRGHVPTALTQIKKSIENNEKIITLDNGCVYSGIEGLGNLLCLNLNNYELIIQPNIEI